MAECEARESGLKRNAVGVTHMVVFVIAAAAPLMAVMGVSPAAFAFGNGAGVPAVFVLVGLLYIVFSAGFTAMSRFVGSAGGFYSYVAAGLGRPAGVAAVFIALLAYHAVQLSIFGLFGFFLNSIIGSAGGPDIAWWIYGILLALVVFGFGRRNIEFSGRVLGICMLAEITILLLLSADVLATGGGPEGITFVSFDPGIVFTPGLGIALVFVVTAFIGFEATAIFGEEARDPGRTIPIATYTAVILISLFYAFVTWCIVLYYGPASVAEEAAQHTATMYDEAAIVLLGAFAGHAMDALLITSTFACSLSFHNTLNRYFYAIGSEGLAWSGLARTHQSHRSPHVAGAVQTAIALALIVLSALAGAHPYNVVFAWSGTMAALCILTMQTLVSLAVIGFFFRDAQDVSFWRRLAAPMISALGLTTCLFLMINHLSLVSGSNALIVKLFPLVVLMVGLLGIAMALHLRRSDPELYRGLGQSAR